MTDISQKGIIRVSVVATAAVSLRNVRVGGLGLVSGSIGNNMLALPLWLLDWAIDMAMGGGLRAMLHQCRLMSSGLVSSASGAEPSERIHLATAARGALAEAPEEGLTTLHDLASAAFQRFSSRPCMGSRNVVAYKPNPQGCGPPVKCFGPVQWLSYAEVQRQALDFGLGLRACGLEPQADARSSEGFDDVAGRSSVCIFENTCAAWMVAALGAFSQSLCVTTVYATLGAQSVVDVVNEGGLKVVLCNRAMASEFAARKADMPSLTHLIVSDDAVASSSAPAPLPSGIPGLDVRSYDDVLRAGRENRGNPPAPPKPGTVAVVMYTSGSTGTPKGVVIEHRQLLATVAGVRNQGAYYDTSGRAARADTVLCYLPLAHIFELGNEMVALSCGAALAYACPKSLSNDLAEPCGAFECFRPTLMVAVPKVLDVLRKGIVTKVRAAPSQAKKLLFEAAVAAREVSRRQGRGSPLFDALLFRKVRAALGGRLRVIVTGGAPLNLETQAFAETCFGVTVHPGYGLTETCGIVSANGFHAARLEGTVGPPVTTVRARLVSCPDLNDRNGRPYLSTDTVDEAGRPCFGRGEIIVEGTNLSSRYFKQPGITAEAFSAPGKDGLKSFRTGDVGCWRRDGSLAIVDRKKNLVKLSGGEYVALELMEMVFGNCDVVDAVAGGVMVYADGTCNRCTALVQVLPAALEAWAQSVGAKAQGGFDALVKLDAAQEFVKDQLNAEAERAGLGPLMQLGDVRLVGANRAWTPANSCLTATNKVQRRVIQQVHAEEIEELIEGQQLKA